MSPTRLRGSRHFLFNRVFRGVGRIQRSAGTADPVEFRLRDGVLTKAWRLGALEVLRLFKARVLSIEDLLEADRRGMLGQAGDRLPLAKPLRAAVDAWLPTSAAAPASRRRYRTSWDAFLERARTAGHLTAAPVVADLERIPYRELRGLWGAGPADWNRARAAVSAFLTAYLGEDKHHPFRLAVMRRFPAQREPRGRVPTVTIEQFLLTVALTPARVQPAYLAMAILGVGTGEYARLRLEDLDAAQLLVRIRGTKAPDRDRTVAVDERLWPWIERAVPPVLGARWLGVHWRRARDAAGVPDVRMYDLRHLSGQLAADAGATDRDIAVHLGHTTSTMAFRYTRRATARKVARGIGDALEGAG